MAAYAFLHDRVQEAAYALIPEGERPAIHLRIGRLLADQTPSNKLKDSIFEVVSQFNRGAALIASGEERERVAELNLIAGERAKTSTAYASALSYVFLPPVERAADRMEGPGSTRYPPMFALEFHRAECEFLSSQLTAAEERLAVLAARAATLVDSAAVACLRLELYTTLDRSDRGVELCLGYLRRIGVQWSPHPTREEVRTEYEEIRRRIGDGSIEAVVDRPLMRDPEWSATLDVLAQVVTPALFTDDNLLCLVLCRMVNISLEHGNSGASCFAYVWLGMIVGPYFDDYPTAFRFGQLGFELVERREKPGPLPKPVSTCLSATSLIPGRGTFAMSAPVGAARFQHGQLRSGTSPLRLIRCQQSHHQPARFRASHSPDIQREAQRPGTAFARKMPLRPGHRHHHEPAEA